ncbi:MAG TPA: hypothetical protein VK444_00145 [Methanobacteriaceae archaeon]|nr:hypothetical protein [Methanobacteriaceae archaeon]
MVSPKKYRQQIDDLGIDGMEIDVKSIRNAMVLLNDLDEYAKILKKIRYNIRSDVRSIRLEYMEKLQEMEETPEQGRFSRKKSSDKILKEKKALKKDRNIKIASYDIVENMVDNYLSQIADAKEYIHVSIERRVG